jgi:dolichol-phosphate mannosyltransferase
MENKILVILPTYNEKENIDTIIDQILSMEEFSVLIVDDNSPDGTAQIVKNIMVENREVFLIERPQKLGLGTAYINGFRWGLERQYDYFIEMDADNSHNPDALPWFLDEMNKGYDIVVGSRYINGTISVIGWEFRRLLMSKFGNFYASKLMGLPFSDITSGFRCYSRKALESVNLDTVKSNGYAFQIEMIYLAKKAGLRIGEMSITFYERNTGSSKMSKKIVREAVLLPWRLKLREAKKLLFGKT